MASSTQQKGPCYLCGQEYAKSHMGRHLLSKHFSEEKEDGNVVCYLLKIEDEDHNYWLFIDIPVLSSLNTLDDFLRAVWCECCGHLSAFMPVHSYDEIDMNNTLDMFHPGTMLKYEYDFGSTTTLYITFLQKVTRKKQKEPIRVLARNSPYQFACANCGKPASFLDTSEWPPEMYCDECSEELADPDYLLPVVNSPRIGVCAYCGELDHFAYKRIIRK